jgi:hypothetical protein
MAFAGWVGILSRVHVSCVLRNSGNFAIVRKRSKDSVKKCRLSYSYTHTHAHTHAHLARYCEVVWVHLGRGVLASICVCVCVCVCVCLCVSVSVRVCVCVCVFEGTY